MSTFIQLAHIGFHEGIGKIAHGILRIHCLHVAELCAMPDFSNLGSVAEFMKENMDSFSEEARLSFVESLMPKDFTEALN